MKNPQRRMSEMPFLKWYPYLAAASLRWQALTLTARGLFHELYDLAARQTPRGTVPGTEVMRIKKALRIAPANFGTILAQLTGCGLINQMLDETLVFPDWNRHQRDGSFRNRGTDLAQGRHESGALDVDVDEDVEEDEVKDFDVFWKAYPRKVGKTKAREAWKRHAKNRPPLASILQKLEALKKSAQWKKDGGQFVPHPTTWLNRGGWDDEVEAAAPEPHNASDYLRPASEVIADLEKKR